MSQTTETTEAAVPSYRDRLIQTHKLTLTNLDQFVKMITSSLGTNVSVLVQSLRHMINNQGMELIILREIEHGIREQSLTPDSIKVLMDELVDLRQNMQAEAEAAAAEAASSLHKKEEKK